MTDNVTVIPEGEHSPWGPSSSKRGINCSGSVKASQGAPGDESVYAAEGTAAHYLSELGRKNNLPCIDWLGHVFKVGEYEFTVDEEMADSAQAFNDWCAESPGTPLTEQRINYSNHFPPEAIAEFGEAFGTLDDARLCDDIVAIKDFKHGKGVQEWAKDNSQLKFQALGVLEDFGYLYDIKGFNLGICQPRLSHYDTWDISTEELLRWAGDTIPGWAQRAMEGTQFAAGDWCQFCRIRRKCAVRANSNVQLMLAHEEFEDLDQLETHALRAQNRLQFITNEQIAKIVPALDAFTKWIKDVKVRAVMGLMNKEAGYESLKLVAGRSNRKVIDEAKFAEKLSTLKVDPYAPRKVISVAVAEAALGKKEFDRRFKKDEDWTKPPGKPKLVTADDKRPAITNANLNDFDNLDETGD